MGWESWWELKGCQVRNSLVGILTQDLMLPEHKICCLYRASVRIIAFVGIRMQADLLIFWRDYDHNHERLCDSALGLSPRPCPPPSGDRKYIYLCAHIVPANFHVLRYGHHAYGSAAIRLMASQSPQLPDSDWCTKMALNRYLRLPGLWGPVLLVFVAECTFCRSLGPDAMVELDAFIANIMSCRNLPGLTVSVVREDRLIYARGYGVKSLYTKDPVANSTRFCIGSLSKGFTATLLAMVIGQNERYVNCGENPRQNGMSVILVKVFWSLTSIKLLVLLAHGAATTERHVNVSTYFTLLSKQYLDNDE